MIVEFHTGYQSDANDAFAVGLSDPQPGDEWICPLFGLGCAVVGKTVLCLLDGKAHVDIRRLGISLEKSPCRGQ